MTIGFGSWSLLLALVSIEIGSAKYLRREKTHETVSVKAHETQTVTAKTYKTLKVQENLKPVNQAAFGSATPSGKALGGASILPRDGTEYLTAEERQIRRNKLDAFTELERPMLEAKKEANDSASMREDLEKRAGDFVKKNDAWHAGIDRAVDVAQKLLRKVNDEERTFNDQWRKAALWREYAD